MARAAADTQTTMHGSLLTAIQGKAALAAEICVGLRCLIYVVDIAACIVYALVFACIVVTYHAQTTHLAAARCVALHCSQHGPTPFSGS